MRGRHQSALITDQRREYCVKKYRILANNNICVTVEDDGNWGNAVEQLLLRYTSSRTLRPVSQSQLECGSWVLVNLHGVTELWQRALIDKPLEGSAVLELYEAYLLDEAKSCLVAVSKMRIIPPFFCDFPCSSIEARLSDFEQDSDTPMPSSLAERICFTLNSVAESSRQSLLAEFTFSVSHDSSIPTVRFFSSMSPHDSILSGLRGCSYVKPVNTVNKTVHMEETNTCVSELQVTFTTCTRDSSGLTKADNGNTDVLSESMTEEVTATKLVSRTKTFAPFGRPQSSSIPKQPMPSLPKQHKFVGATGDYVSAIVTHVDEDGTFCVIDARDKQTLLQLSKMIAKLGMEMLNPGEAFQHTFAAMFDGEYYRCLSPNKHVASSENHHRVFFIDFGHYHDVLLSQCIVIPKEYWIDVLPPYSVRCFLSIFSRADDSRKLAPEIVSDIWDILHRHDCLVDVKMLKIMREFPLPVDTYAAVIKLQKSLFTFKDFIKVRIGAASSSSSPLKISSQIDKDRKIQILQFVSLSEIYACFVTHSSHLSQINQKLQEHGENIRRQGFETLNRFRTQLKRDDHCCCCIDSNDWRRVQILETPSDSMVFVYFQDIGKCETVSITSLFPSPPKSHKLFDIEDYGLKISLVDNSKESLDEERTKRLRDLLFEKKIWAIKAKSEFSMTSTVSEILCSLHDLDSNDDIVDIAMQLPIDEDSSDACLSVKSNCSEDTSESTVVSISPCESEFTNVEHASLVLRLFMITKSSLFSLPKDLRCSDVPELEMPKRALITHINSLASFFILLKKDVRILDDLHVRIDSKLNSYATIPVNEVTYNTHCVAYYPLDGNWYRAVVLNKLPFDYCNVFFTDFGNHCCIPVSLIRAIPKEYDELPSFVFHCMLYACDFEQYSGEALVHFKRFLNKPLTATFKASFRSPFPVTLERAGLQIKDSIPIDAPKIDFFGIMRKQSSGSDEMEDFEQSVGDPDMHVPPKSHNLRAHAYSLDELYGCNNQKLKTERPFPADLLSGTQEVRVLPSSTEDLLDIHILSCFSEKYIELDRALFYHYRHLEQMVLPIFECPSLLPYPCIIAKSAHSSTTPKFFRGVIICWSSISDIEVLFADFGTTETVTSINLFERIPYLSDIPSLLVKCVPSKALTSDDLTRLINRTSPVLATVFQGKSACTTSLPVIAFDD